MFHGSVRTNRTSHIAANIAAMYTNTEETLLEKGGLSSDEITAIEKSIDVAELDHFEQGGKRAIIGQQFIHKGLTFVREELGWKISKAKQNKMKESDETEGYQDLEDEGIVSDDDED